MAGGAETQRRCVEDTMEDGSEPCAAPSSMQHDPYASSCVSDIPSTVATAADESPPFLWSECHVENLITTSASGVLHQPTNWPTVHVKVELQVPLLYWVSVNRPRLLFAFELRPDGCVM